MVQQSTFGYIALFVLLSVGTGFGLPRQLAALTAGYVLDFFLGFMLAALATTVGCIITYQLANRGLYDRIRAKYPSRTAKIQDFLAKNTFSKALVIRIFPLGSNFITNLVAGATNVSRVPFVLGSSIGFIPQMALFSLIGSGVQVSTQYQQSITFTLSGIAVLMMLWLYMKHKKAS